MRKSARPMTASAMLPLNRAGLAVVAAAAVPSVAAGSRIFLRKCSAASAAAGVVSARRRAEVQICARRWRFRWKKPLRVPRKTSASRQAFPAKPARVLARKVARHLARRPAVPVRVAARSGRSRGFSWWSAPAPPAAAKAASSRTLARFVVARGACNANAT